MRCLVTGAAGFIGSHLCERLLDDGHEVTGLDVFHPYYPRARKEGNLAALRGRPRFRLLELDLRTADLAPALDGAQAVFHEAAMPGLLRSWDWFEEYMTCNVLATQRLLEAARDASVRRFVYASSSSVYGQAEVFPLREDAPTLPVSPYGVTKLAAEHLTRLYYLNYGVPTVALRYFTVYGPRQRPDMAFHRLLRSILLREPFPLYGDGSQSRSFTYVADVVQANLAALFAGVDGDPPRFLGQAINVGGGSRATLREVIALAEELTGKRARLRHAGAQKGDVDRTEADLTRARQLLGYEPRVALPEGLRAEAEWMRQLVQKATP